MSEAETGKTILPPIGQFVLDERGLTTWTAAFDHITIDRLPNGDRLLKVTAGSEIVYQRTLSAAEARHLAQLLSA